MSKVTLTSSNFPNKNSVYVSCVCMCVLCVCVCVCVFKLYEKTTFLRSIYEQKNLIFDMIG